MAFEYAAAGRLRKLRAKVTWETIKNLAQYKGERWNNLMFPNKGIPDYIDANLEQKLESMKCLVESLMRNEVLLCYAGGFMFPKRPYQEEFEGRILRLIDDQEDEIRQLEEDMRKTKDTFMYLPKSLIATLKVLLANLISAVDLKDENEIDATFNPCELLSSNESRGFCQVGFREGHMGWLRERCRSGLGAVEVIFYKEKRESSQEFHVDNSWMTI
uniref:Uncharacterized protein n=1 Tax=Tanacetum cinerariifolium TaxID=118510 RepID=A0A6L2JT81_TANCI|nr:hypothetical protein [Tanacetum cinerariifolium]